MTLFWFRRDIRLEDNAGLYYALKNNLSVLPIFIFDENILDDLIDKTDARVNFIYNSIAALKSQLQTLGCSLIVRYGKPKDVWQKIMEEFPIKKVYANHDYEPYAIKRDSNIEKLLATKNITFHSYKDHVIFEKDEVLKDDGTPYTVFTPYSRKWKKKLITKMDFDASNHPVSYYFKSYPTQKYLNNLYQVNSLPMPSLPDLGFKVSSITIPPKEVPRKLIKAYSENRDYPSENGTSKLGIHFRFGTISIRQKARSAQNLSTTYLNELIWRDFYSMILNHFPKVIGNAFRPKYEFIEWRDNEQEFEQWKLGKTGYPLVDAGMRELIATGFMHNRVRMVVASFLTKHLLIDWRKGEAWFAQKLLDYDLASNNGGWQWVAGCGTDAAPYFRIFNPSSQLKKFDPKLLYVKKWIAEFGTSTYPEPMVEHKFARTRCLQAYKDGLAKASEI